MVLNQAPGRNDTEYHQRVEPILRSYASPGTQVDLCYPDGPPTRFGGEGGSHMGFYASIPALVDKAVWAEKNGYDAVIQSNNFEPGVEASRLAVRIPVLGLCQTTMLAAANFADRIGVTVPLDGYFVLARRLLQAHGVDRFVADLRTMSLDAVPNGDEVARQRPIIFKRAVEVMRALVREAGAECIVPLGGAIIPYIVDPKDLEPEVGAPVLNPKSVGIRTAEMCVSLGITHSPLTYPLATRPSNA
ncbi:MAG TPA: aspartate/glutamate racemase family protein [Chloroflexota bacterium]